MSAGNVDGESAVVRKHADQQHPIAVRILLVRLRRRQKADEQAQARAGAR
jgi:hypothetical protein